MQSTTPHEIVVGLVVCFLFLGITKGYGWINRQIDAWNDRQAMDSVTEMEKDPVAYADRMVRRQRMMLGLTIYVLCCDLFVAHMGWPGMTPLKATFAIAAGVCALISGAAGKESTEAGVRDALRKKREACRRKESCQRRMWQGSDKKAGGPL